MDYDRIILEMLDRIKTLEEQMAELRENAGTVSNEQSDKAEIKSSKKYRRLTELLDTSHERTVSLTFDEIEKTIGFSLPESAREHRAFWANTTTHSIALSWLSIGYKTVDVNMNTETIVFERKPSFLRGETSMNTNELWNRIVSLEGETFFTVTGLPFTYKMLDDNRLQPIRNGSGKWIVSKEMFEKANAMLGGNKTDFNKAIIAPSYVYGILTDRRIAD